MNPEFIKNIPADILPSDDVLSQCIHCGMCLSVCPTYELTKNERSSPRGRIKMIKSVTKGELVISNLFADEMNFCLDCQACESACPAGVKYGKLVESARVIVDEKFINYSFKIKVKRFLLRKIIGDKHNLKIAAKILRFYQRSSLKYLFEEFGILKLFLKNITEISKLSPKISGYFSDERIPVNLKPETEAKYKTAFHYGCIMNVAFADINLDTVNVLKAFSCEVFTPRNQVCCGSLHAHNGDMEFAKDLVRKNIDAFEKAHFDFLISNSAGCGAFMKEYGYILKNDQEYSEKAKNFSNKVKDISEFLFDKTPALKLGSLNIGATYHDACHLVHSQKIKIEPRELLKSIPGLELVEMKASDACCGSAGIYNVTRYKDSLHFLENKILSVKETGVPVLITGNPGCISQLVYGADKYNCDIKIMHLVTLIKEALYKDISQK